MYYEIQSKLGLKVDAEIVHKVVSNIKPIRSSSRPSSVFTFKDI